jgi:hypothetical protein
MVDLIKMAYPNTSKEANDQIESIITNFEKAEKQWDELHDIGERLKRIVGEEL